MNGVRKYIEEKDIKKLLDLFFTAVCVVLFSLLSSPIQNREGAF